MGARFGKWSRGLRLSSTEPPVALELAQNSRYACGTTRQNMLKGCLNMHKKRPSIEVLNMPETLKSILGPPPLLRYEDRRSYDALMAEVTASIVPTDTIEWLLTKDVVDASWEIIRYRRFKAALIDSEIAFKLHSVLPIPHVPETTTYETTENNPFKLLKSYEEKLTHTISEEKLDELKKKRAAIIEERRASPYFAERPRDYSTLYASAFVDGVDNVNKIEVILLSAERRRNGSLSKIEQYRASRAAASRQATSSKTIEGDFRDLSAANTPRKIKKSA
jgi:hypothetical protein